MTLGLPYKAKKQHALSAPYLTWATPDLPVEQPIKFELAVNVQAAKTSQSRNPTDAAGTRRCSDRKSSMLSSAPGQPRPMRSRLMSDQVRNSLKVDERRNGKPVHFLARYYPLRLRQLFHSARAARASRRLLERDLGEASEFARVQAFPILGLEFFQCP